MTLQLTKKHSFDTVSDSQKVFRLILEAMSNPTRTVNISEYAIKMLEEYPDIMNRHPSAVFTTRSTAFLALAMTLLDNEVSFSTCGNHSLSDEIASLTLSKVEQIENADFIFVCDPNDVKAVIESAKCGTLMDPHKSATIIIKNDGDRVCQLTLFGPGIDGQKEVQVAHTVKDAIESRNEQNYEYPQGIDLIFVSGAGELIAVPRLVKVVQ